MIPEPYKSKALRFNAQVGLNIKKARGKLSQEKLGISVGLTRTSINNIEHGRQRIMLDTLMLISDILDVPLNSLLPDENIRAVSISEQIPSDTSQSVRDWILVKVLEEK